MPNKHLNYSYTKLQGLYRSKGKEKLSVAKIIQQKKLIGDGLADLNQLLKKHEGEPLEQLYLTKKNTQYVIIREVNK